MDFSENKQLYDRLQVARWIAHRLAGTASESEQRCLERWLQESPEHQQELVAIEKQIQKGYWECPESKEMWVEFENRVGHSRVRNKRHYYWYAAVLILPICLALFLHYRSAVTLPEKELVVEERIVPGETKARLILANGESIGLEKMTEIQIQENNGTKILRQDDQLQYHVPADSIISKILSYNTLIVPVGGEYSIRLSDGTQVWLNANSSLKYPVAFLDGKRRVELEGEAYFEVSRDERHPFVVQVNGVDITVLGTSFNVSAYDKTLVTTLVEGKVSLDNGERQVTLFPDQQAVWEEGSVDFKVSTVVAKNYALWKEGIFCFMDADLGTIMESLARWYDFQIVYIDPELKDLHFSVEMKRYEDVETVLRKIAYTGKVRFNIQEKTVLVTK